jgi:hypothetical protein
MSWSPFKSNGRNRDRTGVVTNAGDLKPSRILIGTVYNPTNLQMFPAVGDKAQRNCVVAIDFVRSGTIFAFGFISEQNVTAGAPDRSIPSESVQIKADTTLVLDKSQRAVAYGLRGRKDVYSQNSGEMYLFQGFHVHVSDIASYTDGSCQVPDHKGRLVPLMIVTPKLCLLSHRVR